MPAGSVAVKERHQPRVLVETAGLSEEEWLAYRQKGIGGSDVAALLGISPWRTARDLFYDKLNIAVVEDHEDNWVALEMGHLLEPLVAKIFQHRTGYKIYQIKKMFQHPKYPWMLADVDYFVELPDGTTAILEIKTTNYNAKDNWWLDGEETIPAYYESQGRHYMAVMDVDRCFFCCLYGNNEQESIIRDMQRDLAYLDIYRLDQHKDEIIRMDGFGEKSWQRLWDAIQQSRNTTFERYVIAMDIPMVGNTASRALCREFHGSLDEFRDAVYGGYDFRQLPDFGETLHNNIQEWFNEEENFCIWEELQMMMNIQKPAETDNQTVNPDNPFSGKTIVVTGKVEPYTRDEMNSLIASLGAVAGSSVTRKTDYLVCGEKAGSKLSKARELGITVLTPEEFFRMANVA